MGGELLILMLDAFDSSDLWLSNYGLRVFLTMVFAFIQF
jgi:hypothetical protein